MTIDERRPVVVLTHRVHSQILDVLDQSCEVVANQAEESLPANELRRRAAHADALMAFMPDQIDGEFLDACPRLRVIAGALKGYDNIDVEACTDRGVWLTRVEDLLTEPTAELAVGLLIGLARNVAPGDRRVRSGFPGWRPVLYGRTLVRANIGIVGAGVLGQAVAKLLQGFDAGLLYHDPAPVPTALAESLGLERADLGDLLERCDAVVVCAPLAPDTLHLLDRRALESMRPGALLVNIGRGSVVREDDVYDLLCRGHLGGYAADVFEFEDLSRAERPAGPHSGLMSLDSNTLFTPHLGSAVASARLAIEKQAASAILQALAGEKPDGAVNDPRGEPLATGLRRL